MAAAFRRRRSDINPSAEQRSKPSNAQAEGSGATTSRAISSDSRKGDKDPAADVPCHVAAVRLDKFENVAVQVPPT